MGFRGAGRRERKSSKKAASNRANGLKGGRPGSTGMKSGEVDVMSLAGQACDKLGDDHPEVKRLMGILIAIQEGREGFRGRYVPTKLKAVSDELKYLLAKPAPKAPAVQAQALEGRNLIIVNAILQMPAAAIAHYADTGELPQQLPAVANG